MSFAPSRWLPGPHLMTIVGRQARPRTPSPGRRERWELPDGDFLEVEVLDAPEGAPGLVVLHGLEGHLGFVEGHLGTLRTGPSGGRSSF